MNIWLRLLLYIVKKVTAIAIIVFLIVAAAFIAYDCANIYVVVNEGLAQRASFILNGEENIVALNKFFTQNYLNSDFLLKNNIYREYRIKSYDVNIKIKKLWTLPWKDTATATVEEYIPEINGELVIESDKLDPEPPPWQNGEKTVILKKINGRWKINKIIFNKPISSHITY